MKRVAMSFGISLAVVGLLMAATRDSLLASVLVAPGLRLSAHLVPESAWVTIFSDPTKNSPWMYFYVVFGVLVDGLLFTWPVLFVLRFLARRFSK